MNLKEGESPPSVGPIPLPPVPVKNVEVDQVGPLRRPEYIPMGNANDWIRDAIITAKQNDKYHHI